MIHKQIYVRPQIEQLFVIWEQLLGVGTITESTTPSDTEDSGAELNAKSFDDFWEDGEDL